MIINLLTSEICNELRQPLPDAIFLCKQYCLSQHAIFLLTVLITELYNNRIGEPVRHNKASPKICRILAFFDARMKPYGSSGAYGNYH